MAPVSEMHHVHTLTRSYEVECCTEFEGSLQQSHSKCQKNPGHVGFIPITEFGLSHLPDKYRDQRIVDVIKAEAELTVRLLVKYTSPARPDGYNAFNMRGKPGRRVGSGLIAGGMVKFTAKDNEKCPCPECEASGDPKMEWGKVEINTAIHVVYDSSEAKETLVHIFADADKPGGMHKLRGYNVGMPSQSADRCFLYAATHDLRLYDYLKSMTEQRRNKWRQCVDVVNKFVAIVSHPHGCSKQVTTGEWMTRSPVGGTTKFLYNVPTCPGSSGAPVIVFQKHQERSLHPHSCLSREPGLNESGRSLDAGPIPFPGQPIIGEYGTTVKDKKFTGLMQPVGWDTLFEPEQERPESPVQPLYDYQQRPPPQASS